VAAAALTQSAKEEALVCSDDDACVVAIPIADPQADARTKHSSASSEVRPLNAPSLPPCAEDDRRAASRFWSRSRAGATPKASSATGSPA
jgi:hypothetical protein